MQDLVWHLSKIGFAGRSVLLLNEDFYQGDTLSFFWPPRDCKLGPKLYFKYFKITPDQILSDIDFRVHRVDTREFIYSCTCTSRSKFKFRIFCVSLIFGVEFKYCQEYQTNNALEKSFVRFSSK